MTIDEQLSYLAKGTTEIIRSEELRTKLERSAATGKPLRVKLGADPTAPDIHLGHTVVIRKLVDEKRGQDAHVSGEADQIDLFVT